MARCSGKTKAGNRCRRPAVEGSEFCATHRPEESSGPRRRLPDWEAELSESTKTLLGFAIVGVIVLWAMAKSR